MAVARYQQHPPPRQPKGVAFGLLCVLASATVACARARADAPGWTLHWQAPSPCPSELFVRGMVQHWLTQSLAPHDPRGISVDAKVERKPEGFVLDLTLSSPTGGGHERLLAAQCKTLAGVVALKVALAADPGALLDTLAADSSAGARWGLRLTAGIGPGVLPGLGPMLELTGRRTFSRIALELGVGYGLANRVHYAQLPAVGADVDLSYARARICMLPDIGAVQFPLCGGADLGVLRGRGFGLHEVSTATKLYGALAISPGLRWPLTSVLAACFGFEALIAFRRPVFHVQNLDTLYIPEKIGARVQVGVEIVLE